ncbi:MAG: DUF359 domain-containing protein [Candidatus Micrarchaeota archaeon]
MRIPERIRSELKKPLGALHRDFREIRRLSRTHRVISVGDVCTLGLLAMGIKPHLAVFDHLFMRHRLDPGMVRILELHFRKPRRYRNPPGTISRKILDDAAGLLSHGGAVLIDGEEDLTALAFILAAQEGDVVIYGQPGQGMVVVKPDEKIKKKVRGWLSAAAALGHEVEGHVGE